MKTYILRRLLLALLTTFGISVVVFALMHLTPGDPIVSIAGRETDPIVIEALRREWGFDKPKHIQYFMWLNRALRGEFGVSMANRMPVTELIGQRLHYTVRLNLVATVIGLAIAFPVGVISAVKKYSLFDYIGTFLALLSQSMPSFWLSLMLIYRFAYDWRILPTSGVGSWQHYVLPSMVLGTAWASGLTRMIRGSVLEVLSEDYIRTAKAKGLSTKIVTFRHALRNAMVPIATSLTYWFAYLIMGSVIVEQIFAWPGIGRLMVTSLSGHDFFVVQAIILLFSLAITIANLLVDILYCFIDPRIRYD
ncbi:MAG: ABC transporter permease [Symbiobacteriaceae bacterium]|nr:ABC transporter permease [Symbiobacteriaceae bacterium]